MNLPYFCGDRRMGLDLVSFRKYQDERAVYRVETALSARVKELLSLVTGVLYADRRSLVHDFGLARVGPATDGVFVLDRMSGGVSYILPVCKIYWVSTRPYPGAPPDMRLMAWNHVVEVIVERYWSGNDDTRSAAGTDAEEEDSTGGDDNPGAEDSDYFSQ